MKVSIITVCLNSAKTIADTIRSVQTQTYPNLEHIIIDGNSQDSTFDVIMFNGHKGPLICEKDFGIYDAMNKGVSVATGDIVGILNSDDFYTDNKVIEDVVAQFIKQGCDALYADLNYIDNIQSGKIIRKWRSGRYVPAKFDYGWMPPHPTIFLKKNVYDKYGAFNTELNTAADYEIVLRLLYKNKVKAYYMPRVLVNMRTGGLSNRTIKHRLRAHIEDYRAWTSNGIRPHWYTLMLKPVRKMLQFL